MTAASSMLIKGETTTAGMDSVQSVAAAPADVESSYTVVPTKGHAARDGAERRCYHRAFPSTGSDYRALY
ncbi:hypothetical protein PI125_g15569 [Phytophthora idaei]|nr:hypothetical protein PI125_g15569 [Phytophthora idaei]